MKDSYKVLENEKIEVTDCDNHKNLTEYNLLIHNLEQILKEVNVKEYLEKELKRLEEKAISSERAIKRGKKIELVFGLYAIASPIFFGLLSYFMQINWKLMTFATILVGLSCVPPLILAYEISNKSLFKVINGCKIEIEEIKKELEKTKNNIKELQNNKSNTKGQEIKNIEYIKESSVEQLKALKEHLLTYYSLGVHEKELSKYYQQGKLDKALEKEFDEDEIGIIKNHFEEKGTALVKKKK